MPTPLNHYVNTSVPEAAAQLMSDDAITFSVLANILQAPCAHTFTDGEIVILCHSTPPYPVWVWCRDIGCAENIAAIAACIKAHFPAEDGFLWNMTYTLFEALKAADPYFAGLSTAMGLLSYRMDELLPVTHPCGGYADTAKPEEIDLLCRLWHDASLEMEGFDHDEAFCYARVTEYMDRNGLFVWRSETGEITAMTARRDTPPFSKVATVYTLPQHRRKGYAMNLVHAVSAGILADGLTPILYTDANYPASNACYQKIGFRQVGALCCAGKKAD